MFSTEYLSSWTKVNNLQIALNSTCHKQIVTMQRRFEGRYYFVGHSKKDFYDCIISFSVQRRKSLQLCAQENDKCCSRNSTSSLRCRTCINTRNLRSHTSLPQLIPWLCHVASIRHLILLCCKSSKSFYVFFYHSTGAIKRKLVSLQVFELLNRLWRCIAPLMRYIYICL